MYFVKCLSDINDHCASASTLKFGSRIDLTFMARPSDRIIDFYWPLMLSERSGLYSYNKGSCYVREMTIFFMSYTHLHYFAAPLRNPNFYTIFSRILVFLSFSYISLISHISIFLVSEWEVSWMMREMTIRFVAIIARRSRSHYITVGQSHILRVIHDDLRRWSIQR